jgi:hypothetical protein
VASSLSDPTSRRQFLATAGAAGVVLLHPSSSWAKPSPGSLDSSVVLQWNDAFLEGVRTSKLGPPMVARALAAAHTCIYDAWAAYDGRALGTCFAGALRRPPSERKLVNIKQAISVAAYRAAADLFPASVSSVFDPLMASLGYDPRDPSIDTSTPTGIGNVAAHSVLEFRHRDGANQMGDEAGGTPGVPYSDYTGYSPVNDPMDVGAPLDPGSVHDPNSWQPLRYVDAAGAVVTPAFVAPHWQQVTGFALAILAWQRAQAYWNGSAD